MKGSVIQPFCPFPLRGTESCYPGCFSELLDSFSSCPLELLGTRPPSQLWLPPFSSLLPTSTSVDELQWRLIGLSSN